MSKKRLLIVKMSSLGDIVHALPAISDLKQHHPDWEIDWVVEAGFKDIPTWHPGITRVIPIELRKWRKNLFKAETYTAIKSFISALREKHYDYILDAQGLIKSAIVSKLARGDKIIGLDKLSAKEPFSSRVYHQKVNIPWDNHAIDRVRALFAKAFAYEVPQPLNYGLDINFDSEVSLPNNSVFLLHGTTWATKHYLDTSWKTVANELTHLGFHCYVTFGNDTEKDRALYFQSTNPSIKILPKMPLSQLVKYMKQACGVISVDTGLAHVACALDLPTLSIYGPTKSAWTGTKGLYHKALSSELECAPCLKKQCEHVKEEADVQPCMKQHAPHAIVQSFLNLLEEVPE